MQYKFRGASRTGPILLVLVAALTAGAQTLPDLYASEVHGDPPFLSEEGWRPLLNGTDLAGWHSQDLKATGWFTASSVRWRRISSPTRLTVVKAPGDRIVNGVEGKIANLVTSERFGDLELYFESMTAKGSNSGVYLHGLYEVQIFDSYGHMGHLTVGDCGGIYQRSKELGGGSPPRRNACRQPGEWQSLHIWFRAPRFDANARKVANARFLRVMLNDVLVQEGVDLPGPTQSGMPVPEAAENPLMLQGDHGPIAFRYIYARDLAGGKELSHE